MCIRDRYKDRATDRRKAAEADEKLLDRRLADIETELAQAAERQRELDAAVTHESAVSAQLTTQDTLVAHLRQQRALACLLYTSRCV